MFYRPTKTLEVTFISLFSFFKDQFRTEIIKQVNFFHVIGFSFDARYVKFYPFSFQYHKQCPINNI